ncbi:MAG TPA: DUF4129 domain-containing protein [Acidimicrobiales bacterium]|nr:DUF4129 domain-containing protein [Acidimicrobiales bacterium]
MAASEGPPAGEIRDRAHEILSRSEFGRHESLVQRVLDWVGEQLSRFTFGLGGGPGFLGDLIGLLVLGGVIVLLVLLVRAFLRRNRAAREEPADDLSIELEHGRAATDWRTDAERFEAAGQWREAMRARYRELVTALVEARVLADLPGRTTGEYLAEYAAARPAGRDAFEALTRLFEGVWYGGVTTGAQENEQFRRLANAARSSEAQAVGV